MQYPNPVSTFIPTITNDILTNPGVGFIAAPGLGGKPETIEDSRGNAVAPYRFSQSTNTWNHPDSAVTFCGLRWKDLEPQQGEYRWEILDTKLEQAKQLGCTAIVRIAPYALAPEEDIPLWLRRRYPEEPAFPFWRIDPTTTDYPALWAAFIQAFAQRYNGHPVIESVDMAIVGAWGEGGGTEFMQEKDIAAIVQAYTHGFTKTPLQALLHDPKSLACIHNTKASVGFRVDCLGDMGGFYGNEWSHMLDFYPQNIVNFGMKDAWKQAPVVFEACWHMNDWYLQGWDIDYIVEESLKWHISSYNSKGTPVPEAWRPSVEHWLRHMGYRFEIHQCSFSSSVLAGSGFYFEFLVANSGVAPCYHQYPPVLLLTNKTQEYSFTLEADIRSWLPGQDHLVSATLPLSGTIPAGEYSVSLGFPVPEYSGKTLQLAIEGRQQNGFYPMGTTQILAP